MAERSGNPEAQLKPKVAFRFHVYRNNFIPTERLTEPLIELLAPGQPGSSLDETGEVAALKWMANRPDLLPLLLGQIGLGGVTCADVGVTELSLANYKLS